VPYDHVCVTPEVRDQTATDNARATERRVCIQGFVWRGATPNDHVCVTPEVRDQTATDNAQAAERRSPIPKYAMPGPSPSTRMRPAGNTCIQGFVWREAVPGDQVCVTPQVREQTASDNAQAAARRADTCIQGFVWREAVPDDHVCVTPQTKAQATNDNTWSKVRHVCQ
jgi:hypothetical protein